MLRQKINPEENEMAPWVRANVAWVFEQRETKKGGKITTFIKSSVTTLHEPQSCFPVQWHCGFQVFAQFSLICPVLQMIQEVYVFVIGVGELEASSFLLCFRELHLLLLSLEKYKRENYNLLQHQQFSMFSLDFMCAIGYQHSRLFCFSWLLVYSPQFHFLNLCLKQFNYTLILFGKAAMSSPQ